MLITASVIKIYIPIWSYCYDIHQTALSSYSKFTFQYGATATPNISVTIVVNSAFTFQYGATATKLL